MRRPRVVLLSIGLFVLLGVAFAFYLQSLYQQLTHAFNQQEQFIPTRIYSDVNRLAPPEPRSYVEERLKALGYSPRPVVGPNVLEFTLHPPDYPLNLVPDGHAPLGGAEAGNVAVRLNFDGDDSVALLQSIQIDGHEIPDIYLEPELVATLSRGAKEVRELVHFVDIPAPIWQAIIAVEDPHFMEHRGLDPRGIARAIYVDLRTFSLAQGGSTITLQLVKNLMARRTRNLIKKANELILALILETKYDKEQILERYLNEVYLGQIGSLEVHGVAEGAQHFFGKNLDELNLAEISLMAGLIRGPAYYSPYRYMNRAMERQKFVLKKMVETGQIAQAEADEAARMPIRLAPPQTASNKAPFFSDFVKAELLRKLKDKMSEQEISEAGFQVYTTLDMPLNAAAQQSVSTGVADVEKRFKIQAPDRLEAALASVEQSTGYIRALIGGRNYSQSNFNRILNMKRQVGSTFKPFVYLTALLKGEDDRGVTYGPGYPVDDSPWTLIFDKGKQVWSPRNYDKDFFGWIGMRQALAHSVNTVTARLGVKIGLDKIVQTAHSLGIESDLPAVPSLSLGVAELSPIELLRAYSILANHGVQSDLSVIRVISKNDGGPYAHYVYNPKQIVDAGAADLMTDMLQTVFTDGTAHDALSMGFDRMAAGKTGTTSQYRDAWFAGYTPQLTTVVWVGMDQSPIPTPSPSPLSQMSQKSPKPMPKEKPPRVPLTGATAALPIWVTFMDRALSTEPPVAFPLSPALVDVLIDRHSGQQATTDCPASQTVTEKYIRGHEPRSRGCEPNWPPAEEETNL